MALIFPDEFQPVCRYSMKGGEPSELKMIDTKL